MKDEQERVKNLTWQAAIRAVHIASKVGTVCAYEAHNHIHYLSRDLRELSTYTSAGDGFLLAVISSKNAYQNAGLDLTRTQAEALARLLQVVARDPALSFEAASDEVDKLEAVGLNPEGPVIRALEDLIVPPPSSD